MVTEMSEYRGYLEIICEYCRTHPAKWPSPFAFRTIDSDEVYGDYRNKFPYSRRILSPYKMPNEFEIMEFESSVPPVVYSVKVFRKQFGADGKVVSRYCCASGKSRRSPSAAYEPCCRKMVSNLGFPLQTSVQEVALRMSAGVEF